MFASALVLGGTAAWSGDDPGTPGILRIGILTDRPEATLRTRFTPLFDEISAAVDTPHRLVFADSYNELLRLLYAGTVNFAKLDAASFLLANRSFHAVPLVMRDTDRRFTSYILVNRDDPTNSLRDARGRRLAFGPRLSTSGHLMPRLFLKERQLDPEQFFGNVTYADAHDTTARLVRDRKVDLGAVDAAAVTRMLADGRLHEFDVRVLWETPAFTNGVWVLRRGMSADFRRRLRNGFLELTSRIDKDANILKSVGAGRYYPARMKHFKKLANLMGQLGLLPG